MLPGDNGQCQAARRSGWAAGLGFEPRQHAPEARGLPLPHPAQITPDCIGSRGRARKWRDDNRADLSC